MGEAALLPLPPSSLCSCSSPRLSPIPHAGASLAARLSPPARPGTPYRTPRPTPARRSIHKKHTQVGATSPAEPGRASAYLGPRPRAGRGRAWGRGGGPVAPVRPGPAAQAASRPALSGAPASGVSRQPARPPARRMLRVVGHPAPRGPGAAAQARARGGRQKLR